MTDSTVASDFFQSLDVKLDLSSKITFYNLSFIDHCADLFYFFTCKISYTSIRIYSCICPNTACACSSDSINISKADLYTFVSW